MKFARFKTVDGDVVFINPEQVAAVQPTDEHDKCWIITSSVSYEVGETPGVAMDRLCGRHDVDERYAYHTKSI